MGESRTLLSGLRVLDVGTFIFGPAAATVMSDFGADVIKIEPPGIGDPYRYLSKMPPLPECEHDYCWTLDSRNKRSVALDLKNDEGRAVLLALVERADVFVTNFPPAVLERLRLTYEALRAINPRLVYAHATGYGEYGHEAGKPGYDATAWWARSGLMDVVRQAGQEPGASAPGMGDHPSAMALFGAIMMALYERERSGEGSKVTSSLLANGVWANSVYVQAALCGGRPFEHLTRTQAPNAVVNLYQCKDRRWLILLLIQENKDWPRLAQALERPDLAADARFCDSAARRRNSAALVDLLDAVFATKTFEEWRVILEQAHITFGVIARTDDLPDDPQLRANGIFAEMERVDGASMRVVSSPISVEGHEKVRPRPAPAIGEHTDEVLRSLGYDADAIARLRRHGVVG